MKERVRRPFPSEKAQPVGAESGFREPGNQVNQLFRKQCERLSQTTPELFISSIQVDLNTSFPLGDEEKQALNSPTLLPLDSQPSAMDLRVAKNGYKGRLSGEWGDGWTEKRDFENYTPFRHHRLENGK